MNENNSTKLDSFLWNLSGFKSSIISSCGIDKFHAKIISVLLIIVGLYAALAWTFFFQTFSESLYIPVLAGLFMGFFIIAFDRALISSLSSGKTNYVSLGFRFLLAILLGVFLSQPMILKFYQPEISREVEILADKKVAERKVELAALYKTEIENLESQKATLQSQIDNTQALLSAAENDFKIEMDGSGGTGKYGYSTVAKQKEKILKRYEQDFSSIRQTNIPKIETIQTQIDGFNNKISTEIGVYQNENNVFGTLIQAEALKAIIDNDTSGTLRFRFYLLSLILILIELSALIAKMLFKMESYKGKVSLIELEETKIIENEKEILLTKMDEQKTLRLASEVALQKKYFEDSEEVNSSKLAEHLQSWKTDREGTAKQYWNAFKDKLTLERNY